jgi:hypothetical protein
MGISLFFFQYSQYTDNELFSEYACHLIDLVKSQIHEDYPLDYERGLAGVGVGFNYLKNHGYFDVGNEYMNDIDLKITKAINYEKRLGTLNGFLRYFLSRYDDQLINKDLLSNMTNLFINLSMSPETNVPPDTYSLLCDLYNLDIEQKKIENFLVKSIDELIRKVHKDPVSDNLFALIKLSNIPSCFFCKQTVNGTLNKILNGNTSYFTDINYLQWLMQCEILIRKNGCNHSILSKIKDRIANKIASIQPSKLDDFFSNNQVFAFQGGFAGLGLAFISFLKPENNNWTNLLKSC